MNLFIKKLFWEVKVGFYKIKIAFLIIQQNIQSDLLLQ